MQKTYLGIFSLASINIIAVFDLAGISSQAEYGLSSIFYYLLAAILFLIPIALVSAELATSFPREGGVYLWVGQAFGQRMGFLAICLQWAVSTIFFPTMLTFAWISIVYIDPNIATETSLSTNKVYTIAAILLIFWASLLATLAGLKASSRIAIICGLIGTIIPAMILALLGFSYLIGGNPVQIKLSLNDIIPHFSGISSVVLATAIFLDYAGIEMNAIHVRRLEDPQKQFPIAVVLSVIFIVFAFILTTLPISFLIPKEKINLTQSLLIAFDDLFAFYKMPWAGPVIAVALVIGIIGQLIVWLAGPSTALSRIGRMGLLPPFFHKLSARDIPINILLFQGIIVSITVTTFTIFPTIQAAFQMLIQLASRLYLIVYILVFGACLYLRYSQPQLVRPFKIPGGKFGVWLCTITGITACFVALLFSLMPPSQINVGSSSTYVSLLVFGTFLFSLMPIWIYSCRKSSWIAPINS